MIVNDVTIVIRSSGENSLKRCEEIVLSQVSSNQVFVISERPFSEAIRKNFEIGLKEGRKWTLALDADVLLTSNAVSRMVHNANLLDEDMFFYQGHLYDKLHGCFRGVGAHLYRTSALSDALSLVDEAANMIRPESGVRTLMKLKGWYFYESTEVYGIHDFGQFYDDYIRKGFFSAVKSLRYREKMFLNAIRNLDQMAFQMYLQGLTMGCLHDGDVEVDITYFEKLIRSSKVRKVGGESADDIDVDSMIQDELSNAEKVILLPPTNKPLRIGIVHRLKNRILRLFRN